MHSLYIEWLLKQDIPLFKSGNMYWRLYRGALVPASVAPCYLDMDKDGCEVLLKKSGAYFMRYSSDPSEHETEWWYIVCDHYDPKKLSAKTRQNINRGIRICSVKKVDVRWLADYGYDCYISAFSRYQNASPVSKARFRNDLLLTLDGPFEYWGVFVNDNLAGYCQCIIDGKDAVTNVTKYDPANLRHRTAYALVYKLIDHYVVDRKMILSNGNRSIAHDTSYQEVLMKIGFRKQYCLLNVFYRSMLRIAVQTLFPLRKAINCLPNKGIIHKVQSLLFQEELSRNF